MLEFKCAYKGDPVRVDPADVESVQEDDWVVRQGAALGMKHVATINLRPGRGKQKIVNDPRRDVGRRLRDANPSVLVLEFEGV